METLLGNLFPRTLLSPTLLPCKETCSWNPCFGTWGTVLGTLACEPVLVNLAWKLVPGNIAWEPALPGNACLRTCSCEPCSCLEPCLETVPGTLLGNRFREPHLQAVPKKLTLLRNLFLDTCFGSLFLGTCLGTCPRNPCLRTSSLLENLFLATLLEKRFLGTLLGNLFLETLPGNFFRKPYLWTCSWETCLGTCSWEPVAGNLAWEPCVVRISLLRPAPRPSLWLKAPSLRCWEPLQSNLGNLENLYLETLGTLREPWGTFTI